MKNLRPILVVSAVWLGVLVAVQFARTRLEDMSRASFRSDVLYPLVELMEDIANEPDLETRRNLAMKMKEVLQKGGDKIELSKAISALRESAATAPKSR